MKTIQNISRHLISLILESNEFKTERVLVISDELSFSKESDNDMGFVRTAEYKNDFSNETFDLIFIHYHTKHILNSMNWAMLNQSLSQGGHLMIVDHFATNPDRYILGRILYRIQQFMDPDISLNKLRNDLCQIFLLQMEMEINYGGSERLLHFVKK